MEEERHVVKVSREVNEILEETKEGTSFELIAVFVAAKWQSVVYRS